MVILNIGKFNLITWYTVKLNLLKFNSQVKKLRFKIRFEDETL